MLKIKLLLTTILPLIIFALSFWVGRASAQVPDPYVDCYAVRSEEFHSLRPHQASPCNQEVQETAKFCGNRLVLTDSVSTLQTVQPQLAKNCSPTGSGRYRCTYQITGKSADYEIDLSSADLPILGNTEDVVNSQQQSTDLNDADKTNDYVGWYLNGVIGRAEYPPLGGEDAAKLVDFSGPIKKLLPFEIQNNLRANTVKEAVATQDEDADLRHDQIVGCTYGGSILGFGVNLWSTACYEEGLLSLVRHNEHRLSEWEDHLPPVRSDFVDFQDYWKAYQEWRGRVCF